MTRTARLLTAAGLAVLALLVIGSTTRHSSPPGGKQQTVAVPAPAGPRTTTAAAGASSAVRHQAPSPAAAQPSPPSPTASRSPGPSPLFRLVIHTMAQLIDVPVAPLSVASHQPVDPPHNTTQQWNTAAWIIQSTNPTQPSEGTAYIYGHACQGMRCAFDDLVDARIGDTVRISTDTTTLTYRVDRIGIGPKTATALPDWAANSTVPNRIVLVTCQYQPDGSSPNNLIVIAHLLV